MGIVPAPAATPKVQEKLVTPNGKRKSMQADFANLKPLNPNGLANFSKIRDPAERGQTNGSKDKSSTKRQQDVDSDEDIDIKDEGLVKLEDTESNNADAMLSPEDAKRQGELAEGVQKIRVGNPLVILDIFSSTDQRIAETPAFGRCSGFTLTSSRAPKISIIKHTNSRVYTSIQLQRSQLSPNRSPEPSGRQHERQRTVGKCR